MVKQRKSPHSSANNSMEPSPVDERPKAKTTKNTDFGAKWILLFILSICLVIFWLQNGFDASSVSKLISSTTSTKKHSGVTPRRIVAIGDLHGDLKQAIKTFRMAGIINSNNDWMAGNTIFVQTGDIVDRGDDTIPLYKLMQKLAQQAAESGGEVIELLGNHEVMNMQEDLRYVTPGDFDSFGGKAKRRLAFAERGWLGEYLRTLNVSAWVNGTVFFHGG